MRIVKRGQVHDNLIARLALITGFRKMLGSQLSNRALSFHVNF